MSHRVPISLILDPTRNMPQALCWVLCERRGDPAWVEGRFGRAGGGEQGTAHHQSPDRFLILHRHPVPNESLGINRQRLMDCFMIEAGEHQGMTDLEGKTIKSEYNGSDTVGQTQQECLRA